ncbi:MAG: IPT/TIG domain-containing protein [Candidatus Kapaibacteriota bacterium]
MPLNTGVIPMTRTAVAVSTASATLINVAGDYTFSIQGIATLSGTSTFTVRPLAAVSAEIGNVQERVPAGTRMKPFSVIYRDRLGNVTDYNKNITFTNVDNPSIKGTIVMAREAIGVSTATASTLLSTVGTYRLSVSGLSIISGATTVLVTSTVAVAQVRFWDMPQNTIAGDSVESFYLGFLNTNAEYKDFSGILRYTHPSGSPSGILALTKVDTGIYKTDRIALTKAGTYRLTVDNISLTTGTSSLNISPDTTVIRTVIDSLRTEGTLGEAIPSFTITHVDRFDNPIVNPPLATTFFVNSLKGDTAAIIPTGVTPQGALFIGSQTFSSTGFFQIQAEKERIWTGNRRIQIYAPKPIITAISPQNFVVGSTAVVTILGRNFAENCSVWYGGQQLEVQQLEYGRLLVYIHQSLLMDSTQKDSLLVINESGQLGRSNKWGASLTASPSITKTAPSKATIDQGSFYLQVIGTEFQELLKNVTYYAIRMTNSVGTFRDFEGGQSDKDTIGLTISGVGSPLNDQAATVRAFRDLGSGTHKISIVRKSPTPVSEIVSALQVFFIANPVPKISHLTDRNNDTISTRLPFDIQETSFISGGWLTLKIHGSGLVKDSIGNIIQSTIKVVRVNNPDSACTVEVSDKTAIYNGNKSSLTVRLKIGDNIIPQGKNKEDYKLIVKNEAFPNRAALTAGSAPMEGGGSSEVLFTIEDSGPEIISFNPPIVRAAFDTVRTITIRGKRFQQGAQLWFKNPSRDSLSVPYQMLSDSTIRVQIALSQVGNYSVRIINPNNTISRYAQLPVGNPYPRIFSIAPTTTFIGQSAQFTIEGRGFTDATRARLDDNIEWIDIQSRLLSNQTRQILQTNIREPLITFGRHRLTVYNDTANGVGGQDTISIVVSSVIPRLDSLRPGVAVAGNTTPIIIYGRNLSSQTKVLVVKQPTNPISSADSMSVVYTPATSTRPAFMTLNIPGSMIKEGNNYLYAVNPGNLVSPQEENLLLVGRGVAFLPTIIRLEPSALKPQNRDTTVRIVGRNFDSTAQVFSNYLTNAPRPFTINNRIADSVIIITVPKEFINFKNTIPFTVVSNGIASNQVLLTVNEFIPTITAIKTQYVTREDKVSDENFLGGGFYKGQIFSTRIDDNIYGGTWSQDLGTKVITTGVIFPLGIIPIPIPLFPKYHKQEYQNMFLIEGYDLKNWYNPATYYYDLNAIRKFFIDGIEVRVLGDDYHKSLLGNDTQILGWANFNTYANDKEYYVAKKYYVKNEHTFRDNNDQVNVLSYGFFMLDTLSPGKHTIVAETLSGIRSNTFTFDVKARFVPTIDRLNIVTQTLTGGLERVNLNSVLPATPFSSFSLTIPNEMVKYIYIIAPRNNAAFTQKSRVLLNNNSIPFKYINHGVLLAEVSMDFIYNGLNNIVVSNPGGTTSQVQNFTVKVNLGADQSEAKVTRIEPVSLPIGNRDTTITVKGTGFTPYIKVLLHHTAPFMNLDSNGNEVQDWTIEEERLAISNVTPNSMTVTIPARFRNSVTIDTLIIGHLNLGHRADTVFLPIYPIITVTSVQPNTLEVDIQGEPIQRDTLTIRGRGFDASTKIWTGQDFLTIIQRSDSILRAITSNFLHINVRQKDIQVYNNSSEARPLISVQYPRPIIDSISPRRIEVVSAALIAFADDKIGSALSSGNTEIFRPVAGVEEFITEPKFYPNAPNPFDSYTQLSYRLPNDGRVKIEVIDRLGSVITTLINEQKRSGTYTIEWNAQKLPSGTYYARMTVVNSKGKVTQKIQSMTLIR